MNAVQQVISISTLMFFCGQCFGAPVPKDADEPLVWVYRYKSSELMVYSLDGKIYRKLKLPDGSNFRSLTKDGRSIVFLGDNGELPRSVDTFGSSFHVRPVGVEAKGRDLKLKVESDGHYWTLSDDLSRAFSSKSIGDNRTEFETLVWDSESKQVRKLDVQKEIRILGWTPDLKFYHGIRKPNATSFEYVTVSMKNGAVKPVFPKDKLKMIRVAFSPDAIHVLGDVEENHSKQEKSYVVKKYNMNTGESTVFINKQEAYEVFCYFSPDGKHVAYWMVHEELNPKKGDSGFLYSEVVICTALSEITF